MGITLPIPSYYFTLCDGSRFWKTVAPCCTATLDGADFSVFSFYGELMVCERKSYRPRFFRCLQSRKLPFSTFIPTVFGQVQFTPVSAVRRISPFTLQRTFFRRFLSTERKKSAPDTKFRERDFWFYERQQAQPVLPHTAKMFVAGHAVNKHFRFLKVPSPFGLKK